MLLQKARKRELELEERKILAQIKYSESIFARCCACILLKQFDEFNINIQQLSAIEKNFIIGRLFLYYQMWKKIIQRLVRQPLCLQSDSTIG